MSGHLEPEHPVEHEPDGGPPESEPPESVNGRQHDRPLAPEHDPGGDRLNQGDSGPDHRNDPRLTGQGVVRDRGQPDPGGAVMDLKVKYYALANYHGVPTALQTKFQNEALLPGFALNLFDKCLGPALIAVELLLGVGYVLVSEVGGRRATPATRT